MAYCPECGAEVSITDKRCSKCGTRLPAGNIPNPSNVKNSIIPKSDKNNAEFILALIGFMLSLLSLFTINYYSSGFFIVFGVTILISLLGAYVIRTHARAGAVILIFAILGTLLSRGFSLGIIFFIAAIVLAFRGD